MKPGLYQSTQLRQELKINPRLYQAMDLLYMPLLDLQQHLKQELLNNPFLEMVEPEEDEEEEGEDQEESAESPRPEPEKDDERRDRLGGDPPRRLRRRRPARGARGAGVLRAGHGRHARPRATTCATRSRCSISRRARCSSPTSSSATSTRTATSPARSRRSVEGVNESRPEAAEEPERDIDDVPLYTMTEAEAMLGDRPEPRSAGRRRARPARVPLLQLREAGLEHSVPYRLVRDCFDELINHRWSEISKRFGISPVDVQKAADEIAKLDPKPGLVYSDASDNYIIPDLVVDKIDGKYHVFLNDANLPRLKLSKAYQEIARDKKKFDGENKEFISNKLNSANWMIQAIEQRRQTMLKVMNYIVDRQRDFFEKGVQYLKPLTLREVAEVINMHE